MASYRKCSRLWTFLEVWPAIFSLFLFPQILCSDSWEAIPKQTIDLKSFLESHPTFDGRGVKVAIFDTGIDPGAPGLASNSQGLVKIIDIIDATGSGDVDTSTVRERDENHRIQGLSGKVLQLGDAWPNATRNFHLGVKRLEDLYPSPLKQRIRAERKKEWEERKGERLAALKIDLQNLERNASLHQDAQVKQLDDLRARIEWAENYDYEDPTTLLDCVVFHDGQMWWAVVDTDADGDLSEEKLMTHYKDQLDFASFGEPSLLRFGVNIYDEGNTLSLVVESGSHGTHVAGILGGHYPRQPELDGIAPGVQIVSVKIGDSRLDGMETTTGFERGLRAVLDHGCDLINLSYGEPTTLPNRGRIIEMLNRVVEENGVIFVASAGNSGPALGTVGAPGGTTENLIGVAASVSSDMMSAEYSMLDPLPDTHFSWSSVGPAMDGASGVDLSAPGAAISSMPSWTLEKRRLANGTSMASPNACGAIATLLSGLKQSGIPYTPFAVKRALENTAKTVPGVEPLAQGAGMIQVTAAFEWLKKWGETSLHEPWWSVSFSDRGGARGLYLRESHETQTKERFKATIRPRFHSDTSSEIKAQWDQLYQVRSSHSWIRVPEKIHMAFSPRTFEIEVDPTKLPLGVHVGVVTLVQTDQGELGPVLSIPVIVVRSQSTALGEEMTHRVSFEAGRPGRWFFEVPETARWAELEVLDPVQWTQDREWVVHTSQVIPGLTFEETSMRSYWGQAGGAPGVKRFSVHGGHVLEVCLGPYWANPDPAPLTWKLTFQGVDVTPQEFVIGTGETSHPVRLVSRLTEKIEFSAQLRTFQRTAFPSGYHHQILADPRDRLIDGRPSWEASISYSFSLEEAGSVTPRWPGLDERLYDAELGSHLVEIRNEGGEAVYEDDAWPSKVSLPKGSYTAQIHFRHLEPARLEALKNLPMLLETDLKSPVTMEWSNRSDEPDRTQGTYSLSAGASATAWIHLPRKTLSGLKLRPGDILLGEVRGALSKKDGGTLVLGQIRVVMDRPEAGEKENSPTLAELLKLPQIHADRLWIEHQVKHLQALDAAMGRDEAIRQVEALLESHPKALDFAMLQVELLDREDRKSRLSEIVSRIDSLLAAVQAQLEENSSGISSETLKNWRVDLLYRKGRAVGYMELDEVQNLEPELKRVSLGAWTAERIAQVFEENYQEFSKWADPKSEPYFRLYVRYERRQGRHGLALKHLESLREKYRFDPAFWKKRARILEEIGWNDWSAEEMNRLKH